MSVVESYPMTPLAVDSARKAEYAILELAAPGRPAVNAGVLLLDNSTGQLHIKLREGWDEIAGPEDAVYCAALEEDLKARAREMGGEQLLAQLEDSLSNVLRITERVAVTVGDCEKALDRLYERCVLGVAPGAPKVLPFVTHLPLYSLRAAAGKFGEDMEVDAGEWVKAPAGLRLTPDMFVARVVGRSMEPRIPDGSLCVFRHNVVGTRQGKLVLVRQRAASESGGEFTIKRYRSRKVEHEDGWRHEVIRLEPLNPDYDTLELEEDDSRFQVLGEFLRVLPEEDL